MDRSSDEFGSVHRLDPVPPGNPGFSQGDSEPSRDSANRIFAFLAKHLKP
jgi:hypothetical protein